MDHKYHILYVISMFQVRVSLHFYSYFLPNTESILIHSHRLILGHSHLRRKKKTSSPISLSSHFSKNHLMDSLENFYIKIF